MKFSKVVGKIDPNLVKKAEELLSQVFLELGLKYDNNYVGSKIGGDCLIFGLMYPMPHICTMNIPTAATDGKRFYWNPKFVLKHNRVGLRLICGHEAWHSLYMHPQRRGSRLPKLWNIAVDYIVNGTVMDDLKARKWDPADTFQKNLGRYMTLAQYAELLKDPFTKIPGFEDIDPIKDSATSDNKLPDINTDRDLTEEEIKELERREKRNPFFFADPELDPDMKRPEKIYEYLYQLLPKCDKCGSIGYYKIPKSGKDKGKEKNKGKGDQQSDQKDKHEHGDQKDKHEHGDQGDSCDHGCDQCGDSIDIFGLGGTVDDHMDTQETQEKLAKRIAEAMESAKRMAGVIPAALEDELGKLTAPKITWQDVIRSRLLRARSGNGRNDWTRFKSRPMFSGLLIPKTKNNFAKFGALLDTSGSMSRDDMAYGVSQLAVLDDRAEGTIIPADSEIYWDKATKIKRANQEELSKIKVCGRGGTLYSSFFDDYEKHLGPCDFLVIITDGYLLPEDVAAMKDPGIDVYWIITSGTTFDAPFGRVFSLKD